MNGWGYLAQTISVGAASFLLGYLAGRTARDVHRIAQNVTEQGGIMPKTLPRRSLLRERFRTNGAQLVIACIVVALGIVTVIQGVYQSAATRRIVNCNEAYANALAAAIDARAQGNQQAQDALDELMTSIGHLAATPPASEAEAAQRREESRQAVTAYVTRRAEVKALQQKNPYPAPPRESCPR